MEYNEEREYSSSSYREPVDLGYEETYDYASFGKRFGAILIDGLIIGVASSILMGTVVALFFAGSGADLIGGAAPSETAIIGMVMSYFGFLFAMLIGSWLYFALQESSEKMATIGKRAMGIVVTDMDGNRISFARASGRYFGKMISGSIMYVGYIMAAFTEKKQALHDIIANCLVMNDK